MIGLELRVKNMVQNQPNQNLGLSKFYKIEKVFLYFSMSSLKQIEIEVNQQIDHFFVSYNKYSIFFYIRE